MFDAARYPLTAAFVEQLPSGWGSYPDCQARDVTYAGAHTRLSELGSLPELPAALRPFIEPTTTREWIPEVVGVTFQMLLFDRLGPEEGVRWFYQDATRLFEGALMRQLMRLMSPTLLVMGAGRRWSTLRRGTRLEVTPVKRNAATAGASAKLTFPERLYPDLFLAGLAESFRAAIDGARGSGVRSNCVAVRPGEANYEISWNR